MRQEGSLKMVSDKGVAAALFCQMPESLIWGKLYTQRTLDKLPHTTE